MTAPRPHAVTATDLFLRLLLDEVEAQGEVLRRILDRLPEATAAGQPGLGPETLAVSEPVPARRPGDGGKGGPVPVTEPAPSTRPAEAQPVAEPAPERKQRDDPDDGTSVPPPPPCSGKGSGVEAWRSFASIAGVKVRADASRDDIIAACVKAGVIEAE